MKIKNIIKLFAIVGLISSVNSSFAEDTSETETSCNKHVVDKHNANVEKHQALCTAAQASVKEIEAAIAAQSSSTNTTTDTAKGKGKGKAKGKQPSKVLQNKLKAAQNGANAKCKNVQKAIDAQKKYEQKHCTTGTPTPTPTPTATATATPTATPTTEPTVEPTPSV